MGLIFQFGYVVAYAVSGVLADSVFNPLLREGGALADSLGALIGVGTSRGIGFMLMIVGVLLIGMAVAIPRARSIRSLQNNLSLTMYSAKDAEFNQAVVLKQWLEKTDDVRRYRGEGASSNGAMTIRK